MAGLLDRPVEVKHVPPKSAADPTGELTCTYFSAFMILETGTDTPGPGRAAIVPLAKGGQPAPCRAIPSGRKGRLNTQDYVFAGRKGPYLLFEAADPNGAVPFKILAASDGQPIYSDATTGGGFQSVEIEGGPLHLRYTLGYNGRCSILKEGQACWTKMAREGRFPPTLAQAPPPVEACAPIYQTTRTPADDPNIISYDVDILVDGSGRTQLKSVGAPGCAPLS
jgi:hypothetical protein